MAAKDNGNSSNPAGIFGKQLRRERLSRGWSLEELAKCTGTDMGHWSRIENGKRPPTEYLADKLDVAFGRKDRYYHELYDEIRTWAPPGFRDWGEHEQATTTLRDWSPTVLTGLIQTPDYVRSVLETSIGATPAIVKTRLANRLERQKRFWARDVRSWFIVDEPSLYRLAASPAVMAAQMSHLIEVGNLPNVTIQVLPMVMHAGGASGFVLTDSAAYAEHVGSGYVFTEAETVTSLDQLFDSLRAESYRASESAELIKEVQDSWTSGNLATQTQTAVTAWRRQAVTE